MASRTWLLLVNGLAPRTTMENRMQISKIRRKYRRIHTHTHTHANTLCISFSMSLGIWNIHILSMSEFRWWCGNVTLCCILTETSTTWNCLVCRNAHLRMDQRGLSSNCVGEPRLNVQKQHGETIATRLTMLVATEHVCNSLGSFVGAACEFHMHSWLFKCWQIYNR